MSAPVKLVIVVLIVIGIAQFAPEVVNTVLVLILLSMVVLQADKYSQLISQLKL